MNLPGFLLHIKHTCSIVENTWWVSVNLETHLVLTRVNDSRDHFLYEGCYATCVTTTLPPSDSILFPVQVCVSVHTSIHTERHTWSSLGPKPRVLQTSASLPISHWSQQLPEHPPVPSCIAAHGHITCLDHELQALDSIFPRGTSCPLSPEVGLITRTCSPLVCLSAHQGLIHFIIFCTSFR